MLDAMAMIVESVIVEFVQGRWKKCAYTLAVTLGCTLDILYTRRDYLLPGFASRLYFTRVVSSGSFVSRV